MGFLFKGNKNKNTATAPAPAPAPAEAAPVKPKDTVSTNNVISNARVTLDDIVITLDRMLNSVDLQDKFNEVTRINSMAIQEREMANKDSEVVHVSDLLQIEKNMYLVMEDKQQYWGDIQYYKNKFSQKSSIDTVKSGAHRLNKHAFTYIQSLEDAFRTGRKLKAQLCNKMLLYILDKGYQPEDIKNPEELEERMNHKEKIVAEQGLYLLKLIDSCYNKIALYDVMQQHYIKRDMEYHSLEDTLGEIPEESMNKLRRLGFRKATTDLSLSSIERTYYVPAFIQQASCITHMKILQLKMEGTIVEIIDYNNSIKEVLEDLDEMMSISGESMSHEEYAKIMQEYENRISNDLSDMQRSVEEYSERLESMNSMLNSFEENSASLAAAPVAMAIMEKYQSEESKIENAGKFFEKQREKLEQKRAIQVVEEPAIPAEENRQILENM